ncbi:XtrA/YqaO family protein [Bacillus atrophaeus]|uniref:XtrA/YqaO family protein n=1 Tax=Bacillus atrophaeus TaxID=1452 RepID=UPI00227DEB91|nr:XtrA/YqaO family protein [Bacillus atrophaeus]MCY8490340.1 XtrA/YqaO family protein [Bacillus atrophaeus]MCY8818401.1 XtrA/YqaO family protein [Bacillus atrophaeus]
MYNPREINIRKDFTIEEKIDPGKVQIIVLDGNEGTAHVLEAPEHKTVIHTFHMDQSLALKISKKITIQPI